MITNAPVPPFSTLSKAVCHGKILKIRLNQWKYRKQHKHYFYSKSAWAFEALCRASFRKHKRPVKIFLPAFFCKETVSVLNSQDYQLFYYDLDHQFNPNWSFISNLSQDHKPDILLVSHYFGRLSPLKEAAELCREHNALLVEDCAHVPQLRAPIGKHSHYQFYSLYKHYPLPNGSILISGQDLLDLEDMRTSANNQLKWLLKRIMQNIFPLEAKPHLNTFHQTFNTILPHKSISGLSIKIFNYLIDQCDLNSFDPPVSILFLWRDILTTLLSPSRVTLVSDPKHPYLAAFQVKNLSKEDLELMANLQLPIFNWPDLPLEVYANENFPVTNYLKSELVCLPLNFRMKYKDFSHFIKKIPKQSNYTITPIDVFVSDPIEETTRQHMLQSFNYIKAKAVCENKSYQHYRIDLQGTTIAYFSVLIKKIGPLNYLRINQGPIFTRQTNTVDRYAVYQTIKKYLRSHFKGFLIWKVNEEVLHQDLFSSATNPIITFGTSYVSGTINLHHTEDDIKKSLTSTWRNQWKKSQSSKLQLKVDNSQQSFQWLKEKYSQSMEQKGFQGISLSLLEQLYHQDKNDILIYQALLDDTIVAANVVYLNHKTATYLIGWSGNEGRKVYANNFLLMEITYSLKRQGLDFLDLGGIDQQHTPHIARFKEGMRPATYQMAQDWLIPLI